MSDQYWPRCHDCGRFLKTEGAMWKLVIPTDYWNGPEGEIFRCAVCVEIRGQFVPSSNATADTVGYFKDRP